MLTYEDIKNQVIRNFGNRNSTSDLAIILSSFNYVNKTLSTKGEWPELQTIKLVYTNPGIEEYDIVIDWLVTDLRKFYTLKFYDSGSGRYRDPLRYITPDTWDINVETVIPTQSFPEIFTKWHNDIKIRPLPDDTYVGEFKYLKNPITFTDDGDVVELESLEGILVAATTGYCWLSIGEAQVAGTWLRLAQQMFKDHVGDDRHTFGFIPSDRTFEKNTGRTGGDYWSNPFVSEAP